MNVLLLGGTGFLGYHAAHALINKGHKVKLLALPPAPAPNLFPADVQIDFGNFNTMTDDEVLAWMDGYDSLVHAAGVDDRVVPDAPSYPFFYEGNVAASERLYRLAKQAGVKQSVMLGSYFSYFAKTWKDVDLAANHPYIRSRVEQEERSLEVCGDAIRLVILELPYIFGSMPGRIPLWLPLIKYLNSKLPLFYTAGGTICVSVANVAQAIVGGLERSDTHGAYVVGEENLTWKELLGKLTELLGKRKNVITVPNWIVKLGLNYVANQQKKAGKEAGLDPRKLLEIQARNTFVDPLPAQQALGFSGGKLDQALKDTIEACRPHLK